MTQTARDLACPEPWADSLAHSRARRRAAEHNAELFVGRRSASLAALVAVAVPATGTFVLVAAAGAPPAQAATVRALHKGARGPAVRRLQHLLGIHADGAFGRGTLRAVKRFQRAHGLTADGVVGSATWSALRARRAVRSARQQRRQQGGGAHGLSRAQVREVQRRLQINADGMWGSHTGRAVKRFQRAHGLTPDGIVGRQTWATLRGGGGGRRAHATRTGARPTVRTLQRLLGLATDGVFGPQTTQAVRRFQGSHGLTPDGIVGPATWRALGVRSSRVLKPRPAHGGAGGGSSNVVRRVIAAGNTIATFPYLWGGGHGSFSSSGYDCSGSVSYALHGGGLLSSPLDSSSFMSWGVPGPGRHITIYTNPGHMHMFMVVDGRRYDTSAQRETGSRWTRTMRSTAGYVVRHPAGF